MKIHIFLLSFILLGSVLVDLGDAQATGVGVNCANKNPTLTSGQTYWMNQNCTNGGTFSWPGNSTMGPQRCHCWSFCGYICNATTAGNSTTTTTVASATTTTTIASVTTTTKAPCKQPPTLPPGATWVANTNCTNGTTYNTATTRCHCWGHCGYICAATATTAATTASTTAATTASTTAATTASTTAATTASTTAVTTASTTAATTASSATTAAPCKAPPTIPSGSTFVSNPGCTNGTTYNTPTTPPNHCHCWGHCGYICTPTTG